MDELEGEYDVVVLGTDITQAIVAGYAGRARAGRGRGVGSHAEGGRGLRYRGMPCPDVPPVPRRAALRSVGG
jgi:hypothetical protein